MLIWGMNFLFGATLSAAPNKKFIPGLSNAYFFHKKMPWHGSRA